MTSTLRSKLSSELVDIDAEVNKIDEEVKQLRKRKQELLEKKQQIELTLEGQNNQNGRAEDQWDNDNHSWSAEAQNVLTNIFKLQQFRPLQKATINSVLSGEDTIVIMSTGGGKSLCYQLPAVLSKGLTLVVSPLISLVEDQLTQLKQLGIEAATLNASTAKEEAKRIEDAITSKESSFRLLYVTPEKLAKSKRMMNKLEKSLSVGFLKLIAIDEVHCCSQWGHDFRPDYKFLNVLKRQFKGVPILGLTATATSRVLEDVKDILGIQGAITFRAGFNRPNLKYEVKMKPSSEAVAEISSLIKDRFPRQTGIVYCFSKKCCEEVTQKLRSDGISAAYYHAQLEPARRSNVHQKWIEGKYQVIVATVAFGMGIDKADVRFIIHHSIPKSVENYYQESGRAGRDGKPSTCILYYRFGDIFRQSTMVCTEKTGVNNLYEMVRFASDMSICRRMRLAEHFEEDWEPGWCQNGCDICMKANSFKEQDITNFMKGAEEVINEQAGSVKEGSGRVTGQKLAELLAKKTGSKREKVEEVITNLLLRGYLQEDFHFTPYAIISYIQTGAKWKSQRSQRITMTEVAVAVEENGPAAKKPKLDNFKKTWC